LTFEEFALFVKWASFDGVCMVFIVSK